MVVRWRGTYPSHIPVPSTLCHMGCLSLLPGSTSEWHDKLYEAGRLTFTSMPARWQFSQSIGTQPLNYGISMTSTIQNFHFQSNIQGVFCLVVSLADHLLVRVRMAIFRTAPNKGKLNGRRRKDDRTTGLPCERRMGKQTW
jgi:hypothetical protein